MHVSASHQSATLWTGLELLQKDGFEHLPLLTEALPIPKKIMLHEEWLALQTKLQQCCKCLSTVLLRR